MNNKFVWSYGWWMEHDKAWFVEVKSNILFCVNLNVGVCEEAILIPDANPNKFALTPFCMKFNREIWCIPGSGQSIWIFHLDEKVFRRIDIDINDKMHNLAYFFVWNETFFVIPMLWNKVIEINVHTKEIVNYHMICEKDMIGPSVVVGDCIYLMSHLYDKIYEFDLNFRTIKTYMLPNKEKKKFQNMCFDGKKFWFNGYKKEVYVWNKEDNSLVTIDGFPKDFGVYDFTKKTDGKVNCGIDCYILPAFPCMAVVGEYVWFIPGQVNKIIYVNKESYALSVYEIDGEDETRESILSREAGMECKYGLEYIRDNRYMGLLSMKNNRIVEIDTKNLSHKWKDYYFDENCLKQCDKILKNKGIYCEGNILQNQIYRMKLREDIGEKEAHTDKAGPEIYQSTKMEGI